MKIQIKEFILSLGVDVCGVANIDRFSDMVISITAFVRRLMGLRLKITL